MRPALLTILLIACPFAGRAQFIQELFNPANPEWRAEVIAQHQKGSKLLGAGLTFLGATAKAGYFPTNRFWVGAQTEAHGLLSNRLEAGLFTRYYVWTGSLFSFFTEGGISYGYFRAWDWDFDNETPGSPTAYRSAKLNGALGLELSLSRRISIEGVGKIGKLTDARWFQPSIQASLNFYLERK